MAARSARWWLILFLIFGFLLAGLFGLFVMPIQYVELINTQKPAHVVLESYSVCAFLFAGTALFVFYSMSALFQYRLPFQVFEPGRRLERHEVPTPLAPYYAFLSFFTLTYAFAVLYVTLSYLAPGSFDTHLSAVQGVYFSTITAYTIGYGDISPKNDLARAVVVSQVIISSFYFLVLFTATLNYNSRKQAAAHPPREEL